MSDPGKGGMPWHKCPTCVLEPRCPKCGKRMTLKTNTNTLAEFWGCDWPKCWGARDYPDAARDRGRLIVEEPRYTEGPLIGGPGDGRRMSVLDGVNHLDLPIYYTTGHTERASYRKQFWPNGAWAWVYADLNRDDAINLLLSKYGTNHAHGFSD